MTDPIAPADLEALRVKFREICPGGNPDGYYWKLFSTGFVLGRARAMESRCSTCGEDLSNYPTNSAAHICSRGGRGS